MPERFDRELCVLGCGRFTTGWNCWEVSVQEADNVPVRGRACWAIGVAKESVRRKESFQLSPQEGIWAVGEGVGGEIVAFSMVPWKLSLRRPLQRLRVRLDYEAGKVECSWMRRRRFPCTPSRRGPSLGRRSGLFSTWASRGSPFNVRIFHVLH